MKTKSALQGLLFALLLLVVAGAGFAWSKPQQQTGFAGAHTILYRIEYFQEDGTSIGIGYITRHVKNDGSWRNVTTLPDGKTVATSGKLSKPVKAGPDDGTFPEHLGYKCHVQKDVAGESWFNGELQDMLKFDTRYPSGIVRSKMYAVDITRE